MKKTGKTQLEKKRYLDVVKEGMQSIGLGANEDEMFDRSV